MCNGLYRGIKSSKLALHHLDTENYEDLDPAKFRVLCYTCHELVELWARRILGKQWTPGPYFPALYRVLVDFLPLRAKEKAREWLDKLERFG